MKTFLSILEKNLMVPLGATRLDTPAGIVHRIFGFNNYG